MNPSRVQEYYEELKFYYKKTDSDWTDKAKSMRTIAHSFYNEITGTDSTFHNAMIEFYKDCKQKIVSNIAFDLKTQLNAIVHKNRKIDEKMYMNFYNALVRLIYIATDVMPDEATQEFIGYKQEDIWTDLNIEQKDIVLSGGEFIYVNAGPGTGKTRLLVHKLLRYILISEKKEKIIALSFTNTAASELGEKFREAAFKVNLGQPYDFYNGTIHSFCYRMMKAFYADRGIDFSYIIIDDEDIKNLAEEIHMQLEEQYSVNEIAECLKSRLQYKDQRLTEILEDIKRKYSIITIEDILHKFIDCCKSSDFHLWLKDKITILVIDEAQDLTKLNYEIFSMLKSIIPDLKIFLVGDPRQNIFNFNGGSYEHLDNFLRKYPNHTQEKLTMTYRCPETVTEYLNNFRFNDCPNYKLKSMNNGKGDVQIIACQSNESEALQVLHKIKSLGSLDNTAVLCNSMMYLSSFIKLLGECQIPYKVFGGRKYLKEHIKIFNHLLRVTDSDNEYSIRILDRTLSLNLKDYPGKNITERFYASSLGIIINGIKDNIKRLEADFHSVVTTILDEVLTHKYSKPEMLSDFDHLIEVSNRYQSISDYLLSFAIDKETFASFYTKDYVECQVPIQGEYLTVSTIHSAKGLEWDNVFILGLSEGCFPNAKYAGNTPEKQAKFFSDEAKKMYVAVSRTKKNLYLTYSEVAPWGTRQRASRFIMSKSL